MTVDDTGRAYDADAVAYADASPTVPDSVRTDVAPGLALVTRAGVLAGAGWSDVRVRSGVAGRRGESWLEVSVVRGSVSP